MVERFCPFIKEKCKENKCVMWIEGLNVCREVYTKNKIIDTLAKIDSSLNTINSTLIDIRNRLCKK